MASQAADARARAGWLRGIGAVHEESWTAPDVRRRLQLVLAGIWLLDAVLQFQAFMFSKGFSQMLGATAAGNPAVIAGPINWSAKIIAGHGTLTNAVFAFIQLAIGLGIAWRPTLKLALGASIVWALGVWWFGEGLGGVLNGAGGPANGAPGAVIIYALLAVLLWPGRRDRAAPFVAGRFTGATWPGRSGWCCGAAWPTWRCSRRPGRRRRSAAWSPRWRPGSPAGWPASTTTWGRS